MPKSKKKSFIQKNGLIAVWAMAGFVAMGYIGFLVSGAGDGGFDIAQKKGADPKQVAALQARVSALKQRETQLSQQVNRLEETIKTEFTASIPSKNAPRQISGYGIDDEPNYEMPATTSPDGKVSVKMLPLTEADTVGSLFDGGAKLSFGMDFATAKSIGALERHWDYIKRGNPDLVEGLVPRYTRRSAGDEPLYTLVVGPFNQLSSAAGRCKELMMRSSDLECRATGISGDFQPRFQEAATRTTAQPAAAK